jgi:hypothetical protein
MDSVKLNTENLLKIVRENREKHIKAYNEAVEDYKAAALKIFNENIELINAGNLKDIKTLPAAPTSYETNYNRAVRMLELSVDEVVELDQYEFSKLVLDEWDWKQTFDFMNSTYKSLTVK